MLEDQRKLVTLRVIDEIKLHPNADKLELAVIGGWQVVVAKGEFKAGDMVVYFEIDSLIPVTPEFEFLRKYAYVNKGWLEGLIPNNEGFRIRTIKLRGELSQGLITPLPGKIGQGIRSGVYLVEGDYSQYFGVIKYDPPTKISGDTNIGRKGNFPSFIVKTKQERVQNIPKSILQEVFDSGEKFEITRKYHGCSITVYSKLQTEFSFMEKVARGFRRIFGILPESKYRIGVCSHNVELDINNKDNTFIKAAYSTKLIDALVLYSQYTGTELAIQGELCGPKLQDNHHGLEEDTIFVFDIFDIKTQEYILPIRRAEILNSLTYNYGFAGHSVCQELNYMPLPYTDSTDLISLGEYLLASGKQNEGLVFKSLTRDFSFKAVSNKFLLEDK